MSLLSVYQKNPKTKNSVITSVGNYPQYPIITYTDDCDVHQKKVCGKRCKLEVALNVLPTDEQITLVLEDLLSEDGSAGVIVNTVKRAQQIAGILSQHFGEDHVQLLHSCFFGYGPGQKEKELFARAMMECSIQLPRELCWGPDKTIKELEKIALHMLRSWHKSPWLKGESFLYKKKCELLRRKENKGIKEQVKSSKVDAKRKFKVSIEVTKGKMR